MPRPDLGVRRGSRYRPGTDADERRAETHVTTPPPPPPPGGGYPAGPPTGPSARPPGRPSGSPGPAAPWVVPGGEPPGTGPDDVEELGSRRSPWVLVVAVFGALALFAGMVAFVTGDDGDDAAPVTIPDEGGATPEPEDPVPTTEAEALPDEEFLALVDELAAYVSDARGLDWLEEVDVQLVDGAAFDERLFRDFEEDLADIADTEVFYRALGLLPDPRPLAEQLRAIYAEGVLGVYFPDTGELYVRGTTPTPYVQSTIVHELVHALDDQHFELDRPEYEDRDDEIGAGFSATVEGNASRIEDQWLSEQSQDVRDAARAEELEVAESLDLDGIPQILLFQVGAPYSLGQTFVGELVAVGGERQIDAALREPPDTSEQFLFPQLYLEGEPRVEVPAPPAEGEVVDEGVVGALFLFGLFTATDGAVNQQDAVRSIDGWGGDWAVTWTEDDGAVSCMRADFVGDTGDDTGELERALEVWTDNRGIGEVSTTADDRVRLESCAASGGASTPQV